MADPITLAALVALVVKTAPLWLESLSGTLLEKGKEALVEKGRDTALVGAGGLVRRLFHLDEKEQSRHLEQALQNAIERGLSTYRTQQERDPFRDILYTLSQPGPDGKLLRQEIMQLFTLSETPDFDELNKCYNRQLRVTHAAQHVPHQDVDVAPYLQIFFNALIGELYADPYFRPQLSDVLQQRAARSMQQSLLDVVRVLNEIGETLADNYTPEEFAQDVARYTAYIECIHHHLKMVGVAKIQNADPELTRIFVPLRIQFQESISISLNADVSSFTTIVAALEQAPCLVLLGTPGSGKSTAMKHLTWSHVSAHQSTPSPAHISLLSGNPLPLLIELRRLSEARKQHSGYDFLTFASQVLLKREGIDIPADMFKELLKRRRMVLIFDGLDEVATMEERLRLVNEIEHFTLNYPGNRVLITSRPAGYSLARVSHPLFTHAEILPFNDAQIEQFLENWYTAVLRLFPIPQHEQEEKALLLNTLKEKPRLRKLAENPLLLTVIVALHRFERLPDRRVQVYDRCADLLLETWAKLKGTHNRWADMKMDKDTQYFCLAALGFALHTRSQEERSDENEKQEEEGTTVDVPSRFLHAHVENFLRKQQYLPGKAEQRAEARRFISLVQEEAGLIVERGTDENGESLFGFVHRTFQEYFAAAEIYERYQQKEDPKIISKFLRENLHDPHWREVIFLLLGKLKSTPLTNQLRQILQGKLKSRRSHYTEILQQDLFFVCDCLLEEIKVEKNLVEMVKSGLSAVITTSPFLGQRQQSMGYLGQLMQTRQYEGQGRNELKTFMVAEHILDALTQLEAIKVFILSTPITSEERQLVLSLLMTLLKHTDLTVRQVGQTAVALYHFSPKGSEGRELALFLLTTWLKRSDLSAAQLEQIAFWLPHFSPEGSEAKELVLSTLTTWLKRSDLSIDQVRQIADSLYHFSPKGSEGRGLALSTLTTWLKRSDLSIDQVGQIAVALYRFSPEGSEAKELALSTLTTWLKRSDLSIDQVEQIVESLYYSRPKDSEGRELALSTLTTWLKRSDLPIDQVGQIAVALYRFSPEGSETKELALSTLTTWLKRSDLSIDQVGQIADSLYRFSPEGSEAKELALSTLTTLLKRSDLSIDQVEQIAESLNYSRPKDSEGRELVLSTLTTWLKRSDLPIDQVRQIAVALYHSSSEGSKTELFAVSMLLKLLSNSDEQRDWDGVYSILQDTIPYFHKVSLIEK